jgi:hypothetical protein
MAPAGPVQQPDFEMYWQDRDIRWEMIVSPLCEQITRKKGCINYGIAVKYVS